MPSMNLGKAIDSNPMPVTIVRPKQPVMRFAILATFFVRAWIVMLGFGIFHHDVNAAIPALGYWHAVVGTYVISTLFDSE